MTVAGYDGRKCVIIADGYDFGSVHCVIFIDDRDDAVMDEILHGCLETCDLFFAGHIVAGDQNLGHGFTISLEEAVIGIHELALSDRSISLFLDNRRRPLGKAKLIDAHRDGAGRDKNHFISGILQIRKDLDKTFHMPDIQTVRWIYKRRSSNLDYDT